MATETEYNKPLPDINELTKPYWDAAKRHELVIQRCSDCGHYRNPPSPNCPRCLSPNAHWPKLSGRGKVFSWVVFHRVYAPGFANEVPYNVAVVELDEGPKVISNIIDCKLEDIKVGMPVEVTFEDVTDEVSLTRFRPV
ncbi:MAG: Zn-ribbon domain-containing OB-fold protein [Chloroflexi bacterium]|nr:Zn-ribbon domain-containing OB-fold protein [Chloroflexota bacterium]